jgi:hypothetical protein
MFHEKMQLARIRDDISPSKTQQLINATYSIIYSQKNNMCNGDKYKFSLPYEALHQIV